VKAIIADPAVMIPAAYQESEISVSLRLGTLSWSASRAEPNAVTLAPLNSSADVTDARASASCPRTAQTPTYGLSWPEGSGAPSVLVV
jgi:hypothetical protein